MLYFIDLDRLIINLIKRLRYLLLDTNNDFRYLYFVCF